MAGMSMDADSAPPAHLHVYIDGMMAVMEMQPDFTLSGVPSGTHEVRIELADNLHQEWKIAVSTEPLSKEAAEAALHTARDILATVPVHGPQ